jgi:hypothetical protein
LKSDVKQWYLSDNRQIVESSFILHKIIVEYQINCGQEENISYYEVNNNVELNSTVVQVEEEMVSCNNVELELHQNLEITYYQGTAINLKAIENKNSNKWISIDQQVASKQWNVLYD